MQFSLLSAASVFSAIGSIVVAVLILLVMITVHEFGHYVAGKIFKFKINEFAIGFGPALFKHTKKNGEIFSVRALPLGGYCAFEGEDEDKDDPAAFNNKKPWQRIIVLISGALMNYILAVLVIIVSFFACGQLLLMTLETEDSSYTAAGNYIESEYKFQDRDVIIACEGKNIYLTSDLMDALEGLKDGELAKFKISRVFEDGRKIVEVEIMMRADADFSGMTDTNSVWECIGVAKQLSEDGETYTYKMASTAVKGFGFFETIGRAFTYSIRIAGTLFRVLGELLTGALGLSAFGGPITTIRMTSAIATLGWVQFFEITALIGVNLAVFNLLPIPALDGSKVVFTIIEWIRGKPVNRKVEAVIHTVGFLFLIGFAILVDILQLF